MPSRRFGLSFENFCKYVLQVKRGKKAIIYGPGYVVLSDNLYKELIKKEQPTIFIDEASPFQEKPNGVRDAGLPNEDYFGNEIFEEEKPEKGAGE